MAVAAEPIYETQTSPSERPEQWVLVPEIAQDVQARARAAIFIGNCSVANTVEISPSEPGNILSLSDAIDKAREGDEFALKMVKTNIKTDLLERAIKTGLILEVDIESDKNGYLSQYGQSMETINRNSLVYASNNRQMRARTEAETLNSFRLDYANREGFLDENSFLVFSMAADDMTKKEMQTAGFFTDTMSCSIQLVSKSDNKLKLETAFVSGVMEPGAQRHDLSAVIELAKSYGVNLEGKSVTEILATPILIPNNMIPHGVIDIVEDFDKCVGDTFFGSTNGHQDYSGFKEKCKERESRFDYMIETIAEELLAKSESTKTPQLATARLHELSERHLVAYSVIDGSINPKVFGEKAAEHIVQARVFVQQQNYEAANHEIHSASAVAQSSSCPNGSSSTEGGKEAANKSEESSEPCDFISKECPECGEKNVHTTVTATHIRGSCGCSKKKG